MPAAEQITQLADGLWSWASRHPEWHPGDFGSDVVSFLARAGEVTLLIDPLLPGDPADVLALIDAEAGERIAIGITIPYHVRSTESLWKRYRERAEVTIHGHRALAKRLGPSRAGFEAIGRDGGPLPGGAIAHAIGRPRRYEFPFELPEHKALVFGDAVVGVQGDGLRVWAQRKIDARTLAFYRERFNPTLEPLLDLGLERVLVTHGPSALSDGTAKLRRALELEPWYHRG